MWLRCLLAGSKSWSDCLVLLVYCIPLYHLLCNYPFVWFSPNMCLWFFLGRKSHFNLLGPGFPSLHHLFTVLETLIYMAVSSPFHHKFDLFVMEENDCGLFMCITSSIFTDGTEGQESSWYGSPTAINIGKPSELWFLASETHREGHLLYTWTAMGGWMCFAYAHLKLSTYPKHAVPVMTLPLDIPVNRNPVYEGLFPVSLTFLVNSVIPRWKK